MIEERTSKLEARWIYIIQSEEQREKKQGGGQGSRTSSVSGTIPIRLALVKLEY